MSAFFKIFVRRNLLKNRLTYLNIIGLVLGMFTFLFIYFYVYIQNNYDNYHPDASRMYHIELNMNKNGDNNLYSTTPPPLADAIYNEVSGIESRACYCSIFETSVFNYGESDFLNPIVFYANQEFLSTFHYQPVYGNLNNSLGPGAMVITRSAALKYFGIENAVGYHFKILVDKKEPLNASIVAVIEDISDNSNVKFELVGNLDDYFHLTGDWVNSWNIKAAQTYFTIKPGVDIAEVQKQIKVLVDKYMNNPSNANQGVYSVIIENITQKHFFKDYTLQHPTESFVNKSTLRILIFVGLITLFISWLNFINFLIFQNTRYYKEIGVRKINGSSRFRLIGSLIGESMMLTAIPMIITIILYFQLAPKLYHIFHFQMDNLQIDQLKFWTIILVLFITGSLLAVIFPVIKLTKFQPVDLLRSKGKPKSGQDITGVVILTSQFILSILLICGILGINAQMKYLDKQDLGFTRNNIILLSPPVTSDIASYKLKMELFKEETRQNPAIVALSATSSVPGKKMVTVHFGLKNREETINKYLGVYSDEDYFKVIDAKFIAGHDFSNQPEISKYQIIINQSMLHKLGFNNANEALGQPTNWGEASITGVVSDYHHTSLHDQVKPMMFCYSLDRLTYLMIKFNQPVTSEQVDLLKSKWEQIFTDSPFSYTMLSDDFNQQYLEDQQLSKAVLWFSVISVIITILGLIGTCLNNTYLRTKEIGIRKVNGAKIIEILILLNANYVRWVMVSFLLSIPIAFYGLRQWLENFATKTNISWWIFAFAGIIAFLMVVITVSIQCWSVASRNPVEALRYE